MHTETATLIRAPRDRIFEVTSDLARWPEMLPHYRWVTFRETRGDGGIVDMACWAGRVPLSWTSDLVVDRECREVHFRHLRKWTKGMHVVWTYTPQADGSVRVCISHELKFRIPPLAPVAERVIGHFIDQVAQRTLATFRARLEAEAGTAG